MMELDPIISQQVSLIIACLVNNTGGATINVFLLGVPFNPSSLDRVEALGPHLLFKDFQQISIGQEGPGFGWLEKGIPQNLEKDSDKVEAIRGNVHGPIATDGHQPACNLSTSGIDNGAQGRTPESETLGDPSMLGMLRLMPGERAARGLPSRPPNPSSSKPIQMVPRINHTPVRVHIGDIWGRFVNIGRSGHVKLTEAPFKVGKKLP